VDQLYGPISTEWPLQSSSLVCQVRKKYRLVGRRCDAH